MSMNPRRFRPAAVLLGAVLIAGALPVRGEPAPVERHTLPRPDSGLVGANRSVTVRDELDASLGNSLLFRSGADGDYYVSDADFIKIFCNISRLY